MALSEPPFTAITVTEMAQTDTSFAAQNSEQLEKLHTEIVAMPESTTTSTVASTYSLSQAELLRLVKPPLPKSDQEALGLIESLTRHANFVQAETLTAILQRNAGTEYLQRHGLRGRCDRESFKSLLPVITYEDLQPEIQRIANGDTSPI
eukprot:c43724_g1_i1 orf=2-448(-)